jgi:hypothetical protein
MYRLSLALPLLLAACDLDGDGTPDDGTPTPVWQGNTVSYSCPTSGVDYLFVYPDNSGGTWDGIAHPSLTGYCAPVAEPYPWKDQATLDPFIAGLVQACRLDCVEQVTYEAAMSGRDVVTTDCAGAVTDANYVLQNCTVEPMGAPETQRFDLTWAPPVGSPLTVPATAVFALSSGRTQTLRLSALTFDRFEFTTASSDATVLLGYPSGTRVAVTDLQLEGVVDVALGSTGAGRIPAGTVRIVAVLEVTEPSARTVRTEIRGVNPWDLSLSHVRGELSFDPVADALGGTLTAR